MRELSRFRGEFLDDYSLRSKLLATQKVQQKISRMMQGQQSILKDEEDQLQKFVDQQQSLYDSKFTDFIKQLIQKGGKPPETA